MGFAQALKVGGLADGRVHEWAVHGWWLGGAEGGIDAAQLFWVL